MADWDVFEPRVGGGAFRVTPLDRPAAFRTLNGSGEAVGKAREGPGPPLDRLTGL